MFTTNAESANYTKNGFRRKKAAAVDPVQFVKVWKLAVETGKDAAWVADQLGIETTSATAKASQIRREYDIPLPHMPKGGRPKKSESDRAAEKLAMLAALGSDYAFEDELENEEPEATIEDLQQLGKLIAKTQTPQGDEVPTETETQSDPS